jgi:hypothetical protein
VGRERVGEPDVERYWRPDGSRCPDGTARRGWSAMSRDGRVLLLLKVG